MYNRTRLLLIKAATLVIVLVGFLTILLVPRSTAAKAEENIEPYGVYTNINLSLNGSDGEIYATAKNKFTLGNSTIIVKLYLYSSEAYTEDYTLMNLENYAYIPDLDQGKTLKVSAQTGGRQLYWCALMSYKFDDRDWVDKQTPTLLFDANGNLI